MAKGTTKSVLNYVGPLGALGFGYDLLEDFSKYNEKDRLKAMAMTTTGFLVSMGLIAFIPEGVGIAVAVGGSIIISSMVGVVVDIWKEETLGK
jgi:hypothetical protein